MYALVGGIVALLLGVVGLTIWWGAFLDILKGGIPLMLILGGGLATYLGIEEVKDKYQSMRERVSEKNKPQEDERLREETEQYKKEIEKLKEEVETLKTKAEQATTEE